MKKISYCANPNCRQTLEAKKFPIRVGSKMYHRLSCYFDHQTALNRAREKRDEDTAARALLDPPSNYFRWKGTH